LHLHLLFFESTSWFNDDHWKYQLGRYSCVSTDISVVSSY
jgi:hypothetical protein